MLKTATINEVHSCVDENNVCIINLGRKHNFNILPVEKIKETEKAIQFGSVHTPRHTIWFPKKALRECKEVPGTFMIAPWFTFDSWGCLFLSSNMCISTPTTMFWIMTISPEKQQQMEEISRAIGEALGRLIGGLIVTAIIAGLLYAILHYLIGLSVTYLQVFGVWLIIDFVKYFLKNKWFPFLILQAKWHSTANNSLLIMLNKS